MSSLWRIDEKRMLFEVWILRNVRLIYYYRDGCIVCPLAEFIVDNVSKKHGLWVKKEKISKPLPNINAVPAVCIVDEKERILKCFYGLKEIEKLDVFLEDVV